MDRPTFPSAEAYVRHVEESLYSGQEPFPPMTRAELVAIATARPDACYRFWPCATVRAELDLPDSPHDLAADLDDDAKARFARSLIRDHEFRKLIFTLAKTA